MLNLWRWLKNKRDNRIEVKQVEQPVDWHKVSFDVPFGKLYVADSLEEGVTLTYEEVSNLVDYIQHMDWLASASKSKR